VRKTSKFSAIHTNELIAPLHTLAIHDCEQAQEGINKI
jgi:hypothetical protein